MRSDLNSAAFKALLAEPAVRAVSFDVFDTALIRTFACPTDLFAELGSTLVARRLATLAPERFAHLRVQAEIQARRQRPEDEPRLSEIYAVLAQRLDWSDEQRIAAELLEISLECSAMVAVPHVRAWIDAARSARLPVAFVSDMYLPASVVRSMLTDQGLARPEDVVLVSCEFRETKARGDLFDRLLEELDLPPDQVLHIGDHPHSDGTVPRAKGFRTLAVRDTALGFCEQRLLAYRHDTAGLSGRLAATARLARLTCVAPGADPALGEIGASLLGPWLTCFALWMFERA
ncbi:MAG: hypothetical protein H7343_01980, partial [Undibacterium sp.]|nr:hypothetical protein [Opitutaceae bacterium]